VTYDQILDHASKSAWVDGSGVELPSDVRSRQQTDQKDCEVFVLGVPAVTVGKPVEHCGDLADDLGVERGESFAELRPAERGDADLREQDAAVAIRGELDEEEVEPARQRLLRIENV
jgi:hypothetical protein